jgi:hypothetical protein
MLDLVKALAKAFLGHEDETIAEAIGHNDNALAEMDREVLVSTVEVVSKKLHFPFKEKLLDLFPEAKFLDNLSMINDHENFPPEQMLIAVGPAKAAPRMKVRA